MTYDFRHAAMHTIADWPVLERIVAKSSDAKRLDSRTVAALYATRTTADDWAKMNDAERDFATTAINMHPSSPA